MPELLTRRGTVAAGQSFEASLSSETPVERWFGTEVLDHVPAAIELSRAKDGLPLLFNHNPDALVGRVHNVRIQDRKLRGQLVFFDTEQGEALRRAVEGGHREVSIGYQVLDTEKRIRGGKEYVHVTKWMPYEVTVAAVAADPTIGVNRSVQPKITKESMDQQDNRTDADTGDVRLTRSQRRGAARSQDEEMHRRDELMGLARLMQSIGPRPGVDPMAAVERAIQDGTSSEDFRSYVLNNIEQSKPFDARGFNVRSGGGQAGYAPPAGYSVQRALAAMVDPHRFRPHADLEVSVSNEMRQRSQLQHEGLSVPFEALFPGLNRALSVGVSTAGGAMVGTITDQGPPIDVFRSRVVTAQLGARFLTGLVGNMQYPRKTATSTLNWTTETGDALETGPTTDQVSLTPKRLTAYVDFSKQLLIQTAGGAEQMLLDDLRQAAAVMLDTVALRGTGASNQPRGIVNTSGIGAVIGGANGAQINWTHVTDLESAVANVDAAQSQCAYVVNTKTRGWLKKQPKVTNQMPIWPDVPIEEAGLERLNGYRCGVTNIMRSNLTKGTSSGVCSELIFGNFSDLLIGIWGDSLDVTIDPYTLAKSGQIRITVHLWADVAVRRQQSFAVMADALTV